MQGKIRYWNHIKGFGFVESKDSRNIFVHFSEIRNRAPEQIDVGDVVDLELSADREGRLCGKNARVLERPTTGTPIRFGDIGVDEAA